MATFVTDGSGKSIGRDDDICVVVLDVWFDAGVMELGWIGIRGVSGGAWVRNSRILSSVTLALSRKQVLSLF